MSDRLQVAERRIALYSAQDADGYVEHMTDTVCEAIYRGVVVRDGKDEVRSGLNAMFAQYPESKAEVVKSYALGETLVLHEDVSHAPGGETFEVMSIYSFVGDKVDRVEFIR